MQAHILHSHRERWEQFNLFSCSIFLEIIKVKWDHLVMEQSKLWPQLSYLNILWCYLLLKKFIFSSLCSLFCFKRWVSKWINRNDKIVISWQEEEEEELKKVNTKVFVSLSVFKTNKTFKIDFLCFVWANEFVRWEMFVLLHKCRRFTFQFWEHLRFG